MKKNLLLICGGGGTEHEISIISSQFLKSQIDNNIYNIIDVEITHSNEWLHAGNTYQLNFKRELICETEDKQPISIDLVIPAIHGFPGETGDLQSYLEMINLPFLGCESETSKICFNKISTKLWLEDAGIKTTPFLALNSPNDEAMNKVKSFFDQHGKLFVKASSQGSSVGCFTLHKKEEIADTIVAAFALSPFVIVEKEISGRELEVSIFEFDEKIHATVPGEIICPSKFYSYDEKYNNTSVTDAKVQAENLTDDQILKIKNISIHAFNILRLRHLSRIDFFLTHDGEILINEINTFPGMTPISMFPKMMEAYGVNFNKFLNQKLREISAD